MGSRRVLSPVAPYVLGAAVALSVVTWRLRLWDVGLSVPFKYDKDALTCVMYVKAMLDNGWYTSNAYVGMPQGWVLYDFPSMHTLDFAIMKGLSLFVKEFAPLTNVYYLLTFPLIAVTGAYALRQLGLRYPVAVAGGVLYSLMPYHFTRGIGHLFLSAYYTVPLGVVLALRASAGNRVDRTRSRSLVPPLLLCLAVALSHTYYVFFTLYLVAAAAVSKAIERRTTRPLWRGGVFVSAILAAAFLNHLPAMIYREARDPNQAVARRSSQEVRRMGLEIGGLVIPAHGYGLAPLEDVVARFRADHRTTGANPGTYVGTLGVVGLAILLGVLAGYRRAEDDGGRLRWLALMCVWLFLLASVGGFGYLLALLTTPKIRAYERVSVFLGFISLAATFSVADRLLAKLPRRRTGQLIGAALLVVMLAAGIIDQTQGVFLRGVSGVLDFGETKEQYQSDGAFVKAIEARLPVGSMVFQLPHRFWPEGGNVPSHTMGTYDHFAGYLHSDALTWSFGAVRGRSADLWLSRIAGLPADSMLTSLCARGFAGIWIDRQGYPDGAMEIESALGDLLQQQPLQSADGRRLFFRILGHCDATRRRYGAEAWHERRAIEHVLCWLGDGFFPTQTESSQWVWASSAAELLLHNTADAPVECEVTMALRAPHVAASQVVVQGFDWVAQLALSPERHVLQHTVHLSPGPHVMRFTSDAPSAGGATDPRYLAFMATVPRLEHARWAPARPDSAD
jgi:phosphoglycerol transferase